MLAAVPDLISATTDCITALRSGSASSHWGPLDVPDELSELRGVWDAWLTPRHLLVNPSDGLRATLVPQRAPRSVGYRPTPEASPPRRGGSSDPMTPVPCGSEPQGGTSMVSCSEYLVSPRQALALLPSIAVPPKFSRVSREGLPTGPLLADSLLTSVHLGH